MVIAIERGPLPPFSKVFNQVQYPLLIKILENLGIEGISSLLILGIFKRPSANDED